MSEVVEKFKKNNKRRAASSKENYDENKDEINARRRELRQLKKNGEREVVKRVQRLDPLENAVNTALVKSTNRKKRSQRPQFYLNEWIRHSCGRISSSQIAQLRKNRKDNGA